MVGLNEAKGNPAYGVLVGSGGEAGAGRGRECEGGARCERSKMTRAVRGRRRHLDHQRHHEGRAGGKGVSEDAGARGVGGGSGGLVGGGEILLRRARRLKAEDFEVLRPAAATVNGIRPMLGGGGGHGQAARALRTKTTSVRD